MDSNNAVSCDYYDLNSGDVYGWREFVYPSNNNNNTIVIAKTDVILIAIHSNDFVNHNKYNMKCDNSFLLQCILNNYRRKRLMNAIQSSMLLNTGNDNKKYDNFYNQSLASLSSSFIKECIYQCNEYIITHNHAKTNKVNNDNNNVEDLQPQQGETSYIYFIIYGKVQLHTSNNKIIELGFDEYFISNESTYNSDRIVSDNSATVRAIETTKCEIFPLC